MRVGVNVGTAHCWSGGHLVKNRSRTNVSASMICACSRVSAFHWELSLKWLMLKSPAAMVSTQRPQRASIWPGGGSCTPWSQGRVRFTVRV